MRMTRFSFKAIEFAPLPPEEDFEALNAWQQHTIFSSFGVQMIGPSLLKKAYRAWLADEKIAELLVSKKDA